MTVSPGYGARNQSDRRERVRDIRSGLPGQVRQARLVTASMLYGPLCSLDELHGRIARTLPARFGSVRRARVVPIEQSETLIPDDTLLKYDDAVQLELFSRFVIATPAYWFGEEGDPWLIGNVAGTERWAVIARWGDENRRAA
jgi:hypothetical protein